MGQRAPDVDFKSGGGGAFRLSDFAGRLVVLYFYPQDGTEGCTAEAIDFSRLKPQFEAAGAVIFGISPDSPAKHERFREKYRLSVDLVADEERRAIEAYGVWTEKTMFGRKYMGVERATFLIGRNGIVVRMWRKVRVKGHADAVLTAVRAL